jgi:hypothetical protein
MVLIVLIGVQWQLGRSLVSIALYISGTTATVQLSVLQEQEVGAVVSMESSQLSWFAGMCCTGTINIPSNIPTRHF